MREVTQTYGYRDDSRRGNCFPACVASMFDLPLSAVPKSEHKMNEWLAERYPGVTQLKRTYFEPHPTLPYEYVDVFKDSAPYWPGLWIATVASPRFTTACHRCNGEKRITVYLEADTELPSAERKKKRMACFACKGKGRVTGLHAVVMNGAVLKWDPSPHRDQGFGGFHGETVFMVGDPAKLIRTPPKPPLRITIPPL